MKVSVSDSAIGDLQNIVAHYQTQGVPEVGARLVAEVLRHVASLRDHPDLGRIVPEFDTPLLRELIHPPFRIVYRRESKRIAIVRVWRSERLLTLP